MSESISHGVSHDDLTLFGTEELMYGRRERLLQLLDAHNPPNNQPAPVPTHAEIMELWLVFEGSSDYVGEPATLKDFGHWIVGTYNEGRGCEVTW